jgi:NAD-dependent deacetylase
MTPCLDRIDERACGRAADLLRRARSAVALTGAGVSVPSGIPDFRSPGGLWTRFDPMRVATARALRENPGQVWDFLVQAEDLFGGARPNPAHAALARLEAMGALAAVITQNIDGLHQAAGSERVIEFHGSSRRYYCMECGRDHDPAPALNLAREDLPLRCWCGGVVRPDFVFYGEHIPPAALSESLSLARDADLAVVVGTSGKVAPANTLPRMVKEHGGHVLEFNRTSSDYALLADVLVMGPAEETLPAVAELLGA